MSHNILILLYYTYIAAIDNGNSNLVKQTQCSLNNSLSIWLMIKLYTFIIFAVCDISIGLEMDGNECVCAAGYYETTAAVGDNPPGCTACPLGTTSTINSACGKNARITIPID